MWRVGNGENIHILADKWIPRPSTYMVQTPPISLVLGSRVADLLDMEKHEWKADVIEAVFTPEDAKLICSLPLSIRGAKDKLIWVKSSKGIFTIKSAYFITELKGQSRGQSSHEASGDEH